MLYKKYHRNYLKQFRKGRRFKFREDVDNGNVYGVTCKPYIEKNYNGNYINISITRWYLISLVSGKIVLRNITWLN